MKQQHPRAPPVEQRGLVSDVVSNVVAGGIVAGVGAATRSALSKVNGKSKRM